MTVKRVEVLAYAKINLMLDIIRRRTDGYHDLLCRAWAWPIG